MAGVSKYNLDSPIIEIMENTYNGMWGMPEGKEISIATFKKHI